MKTQWFPHSILNAAILVGLLGVATPAGAQIEFEGADPGSIPVAPDPIDPDLVKFIEEGVSEGGTSFDSLLDTGSPINSDQPTTATGFISFIQRFESSPESVRSSI